jgi:hypothetical protein
MASYFLRLTSGLRRFASRFRNSPISRSINSKICYTGPPNDVTIARDDHCSRIDYRVGAIPATHLEMDPKIVDLSNGEIIEEYNECLRDEAKLATERRHVAIEVPLGGTQMEYFARSDQWAPKGGVLRCLIKDDERGQVIVQIDEQELRLKQFGTLLATYTGWGMRIEFMPENEVHRRPVLQVREDMLEE